MKLTGVILCGGESRRMGRDKGLILKDSLPWALHMSYKLAFLSIPVIFSINASQISGYAAALPDACLVQDDAAVPGPLKGLLTVHRQFPDRDLLLLACDMQEMDEETIAELVSAYRTGGPYEFYAYMEAGFYQPFCAIYTSAGCMNHAPATSLQTLLRQGRTMELPIIRDKAFYNYNT